MGKPMGKKLVAAVINRDGGYCVLRLPWCQIVATVADHRANRGHGGARSLNGMSNLIAACSRCNGAKEDASGEVREELVRHGVRLLTDSTHAKTALRALVTPVEYPDGKLYYLEDDGSREQIDKTPY